MKATINLLPKQTEAWDAMDDPEVTEIGYGGAAGGGKTRLGWYKCIEIAERYPGARIAVGRKELKTLRITTLKELFIIFGELGYKDTVDYKFNAQDNIVKFANCSEIVLLDMAASPQDPEYTRFGSLNLTAAWAEESNESPDKAIQILKTRVGRHNKFNDEEVKAIWLETFNPNKGRVYREYYQPWTEGTLPSYRRFIRALPGDNPHLPSAYMNNLRRADKTTRERLLHGNFEYDDDPLRLMRYDYIHDLLTNNVNKKSPNYIIADIARFGGDKIIFSYFEGLILKGLYVYKLQGLDETTKLLRDMASTFQVPYSHILIDEDGVGGGVVDNMRGAKGFMGNSKPFPAVQKPIMALTTKEIVPANYTNLRSQCYFTLSEHVNRHDLAVQIEFFETNIPGYSQENAVAELLEELDTVKQVHNSGDSGKKLQIIPKSQMKELLGRSPDIMDTLMMRMYFEFKTHNEGLRINRNVMNRQERKRNIAPQNI